MVYRIIVIRANKFNFCMIKFPLPSIFAEDLYHTSNVCNYFTNGWSTYLSAGGRFYLFEYFAVLYHLQLEYQ